MSTDEPLHGPRGPGGEEIPLSQISFIYYNFINPAAGVGNIHQSVADKMTLARFAREFDVPAHESPTGERILIDPSRMAFMGHSLGGVIGSVYMGAESEVVAAVLSGAGGGFNLIFLDTPDAFDPFIQAALRLIGFAPGEVFDGFHPIVTLMQGFVEPADPVGYGHYYVESPLEGRPKNVFLPEGMEDDRVPPKLHEALAVAAGLPQTLPVFDRVEGLALKGLEPIALPTEGNLAFEGARSTGALIQYQPGDHWVLFSSEANEMQYVDFLASYFETGVGRIDPVANR